jgi:tRNA pseudouridine38-40 synthase
MSDAAAPIALTRWALRLEYDGSGFIGWQRQAQGVSVQAVLEEAASRLVGGLPVPSIVAGRTDAGVHAEGQVAQIDLPERAGLDGFRLREALNFHMKPHAVVVLQAVPVPPDWNARFSAKRRRYRYRILNRPARPALAAGQVWHVKKRLDADGMAAAARLLLGRHDFSSFRAASCQAKSPLRTLDRLDVSSPAPDLLVVEAEARSFLHHQVRNMVGTLKLVGDGSWPVERVAAALAARDRSAAGPTAPPDGLCLLGADYEPDPFGCVGAGGFGAGAGAARGD